MLSTALQLAGAADGIIGAVFLSVSQKPAPNAPSTGIEGKGEWPLIGLMHPRLWRWGLGLLVAGFAIQAAGYLVALLCR